MTAKKLFVIIGQPRSGTSYLGSLLGSHPDIMYLGEVFNLFHSHNFYSKYGVTYKDWHHDINAPLEAMRTQPPAPIVGFKLFRRQHPALFAHVLASSDIKKIVIFRKSYVESYVSWLQAMKTGKWSSPRQEDGNAIPSKRKAIAGKMAALRVMIHSLVHGEFRKCRTLFIAMYKRLRYLLMSSLNRNYNKVKVSFPYFRRYAERIKKEHEEMLRELQANGQEYCLVYYEDIVGEERHMHLARALDFIGADSDITLTSSQAKINPLHLKDRIRNFEQFRRALRGTEHEF